MIGSTKIKKGSQYGSQNTASEEKSQQNPNNNLREDSAVRQRSKVTDDHN